MNNPNKKITIAIPAYNEEKTLEDTLNCLKMLSTNHFSIEKYIFISDGSTDNTTEIFKNFKHKNIPTTVIVDQDRKGKVYRLNQIFQLAQSEILCIFDADILIEKNVIDEMIKTLNSKKTVIAATHQIPIKPTSRIGNIIYTGYKIWDEIRLSSRSDNDLVQNFYGAATAYKECLYKKLLIPKIYTDERSYIYYKAHKIGKFKYINKAKIYYHPISTLKDFVTISGRTREICKNFTVNYIENKYRFIPKIVKIKIVSKYLLLSPINTLSFFLLKILAKKIIKYYDPLTNRGMWSITTSTKRKINITL